MAGSVDLTADGMLTNEGRYSIPSVNRWIYARRLTRLRSKRGNLIIKRRSDLSVIRNLEPSPTTRIW